MSLISSKPTTRSWPAISGGDHYSYLPTVDPFYVMEGDWVRQDHEASGFCIPNVNGRFTVWYDLVVWQWGVFVGFGAKARFMQMDSFLAVMDFLSPPDDDRPDLPFADERKKRYRGPTHRDDRKKRMERISPPLRRMRKRKPARTLEYHALWREVAEEAPGQGGVREPQGAAQATASQERGVSAQQ